MKKYIIFALTLLIVLSLSVFGQEATPSPTVPAAPVDVSGLVTAALAVSGIVSSIILTFLRNKFTLSSTATFFVYVGISGVIALGVTYFYGGFSTSNVASSFAVVFTVGQAVYNSIIKGTVVGEIGNSGLPPSETNESSLRDANMQ